MMRPAKTTTHTRRGEDGFTLAEVIVAMFVLLVGVAGMMATFDASRKLTLVAEQRAAAAHRAQWEIEKLQAQPYSELAMFSAPAHSSESTNPDYYVNYNSPATCTAEGGGCYQTDTEKPSETKEETIVYKTKCTENPVEECGIVAGSPTGNSCSTNAIGSCEWKDGKTSGYIYDFITWHQDTVCKEESGKKFCSSKSDKRLTVVATVSVAASSRVHPAIRVSTIISDPGATPEGSVINGKSNPLENPTTKCGSESCITGAQSGNPVSWYFADSPATSETATAPSAAHTLHNTVAATGECSAAKTGGCPVPDLMVEGVPTATKLYDYSTNLDSEGFTRGGAERGGRLLRKEAECSTAPGNAGGETWASPKLTAATKLTGYGGITLYTQPLGNVSATVKLCLAIYDYPATVTETSAIKQIGTTFEYTPVAWPTTGIGNSLSSLSFTFSFLSKAQLEAKETVTVAVTHHIGVRIWPANSSTASIAIAYATTGSSTEEGGKLVEVAGYPSHVQLNTE
ncbi:MAG TPA: prepilin-type N-terminal cleavage/methylation domain-containing protein [Solirubrobacteraceae bacterium]|jgi:Tfp pilus assembly protein PilV|nr:prepilin-type N-terminal cleavage/methylation domain-containing protein [Solirubrobacteraceae bacterium]